MRRTASLCGLTALLGCAGVKKTLVQPEPVPAAVELETAYGMTPEELARQESAPRGLPKAAMPPPPPASSPAPPPPAPAPRAGHPTGASVSVSVGGTVYRLECPAQQDCPAAKELECEPKVIEKVVEASKDLSMEILKPSLAAIGAAAAVEVGRRLRGRKKKKRG